VFLFGKTEGFSAEVPVIRDLMDKALTGILRSPTVAGKVHMVKKFMKKVLPRILRLLDEYVIPFCRQYIVGIRQATDSMIRNIELTNGVNLKRNPEMINCLQLLRDFMQGFNRLPNEPIDFPSILMEGLRRASPYIRVHGIEMVRMSNFHIGYVAIFELVESIRVFEQLQEVVHGELSTWSNPVQFRFQIDREMHVFQLQKRSTILDAKKHLSTFLGARLPTIEIKSGDAPVVDSKLLIKFDRNIPFTVTYEEPPPVKYRFQSRDRAFNKWYSCKTHVSQAKQELEEFLGREVELFSNGRKLALESRLYTLGLPNDTIDLVFLPSYRVYLDGRQLKGDVRPSATLLKVFKMLNRKCVFLCGEEKIVDFSTPICLLPFSQTRAIRAVTVPNRVFVVVLPTNFMRQVEIERSGKVRDLKAAIAKYVEGTFEMRAHRKPLYRMSMFAKFVTGRVHVKSVLGLRIEFIVGDETFEMNLKETKTVEDAAKRLRRVVKCNFELTQKGKALKGRTLLVLLKTNVIDVELKPTTYRLRYPERTVNNNEYEPDWRVLDLTEYIANFLSRVPSSIELHSEGKILAPGAFLYEVDPSEVIDVVFLLSYEFLIDGESVKTPKTLSLPVEASVRVAKNAILKSSHMSKKSLSLMYEKRELGDEVLLADVNPKKAIRVFVHDKD
jgi:hypothetical protein